MRLIDNETGRAIQAGDILKDFRGAPCEVLSVTKPHKHSFSGRIYLQYFELANGEYVSAQKAECLPGVIGACWIGREDI